MAHDFSEYLRQAAFCRGMAAEATTLERKAAWLRLASKWLAMAADEEDQIPEEPLEALHAGQDVALESLQLE